MKVQSAATAFCVVLLLAAPACRPGTEPDDHHHEGETHADGEEHGEHAEQGEPALDLASLRGVGFVVVPEPTEETAWFAAEAIAEERSLAVLSSPLGGTVTEVGAAPGSRVRAGQVVLVLRSPELAALRAELSAARARLAQAEAELAREERLTAVAATSRRELETAAAAVALARAAAEAASLALAARAVPASGTGADHAVRAPAAGMVSELTVVPGQTIAAGQELGRLVAGTAALARVELALPGPASWSPGAVSEVRRSDGKRWPAVVEGVPAELSPLTRRLSFRLRLAGEELPLPGTPLEVRVPLAEAVVLPQQAIQRIEGSWGVFVAAGDRAVFRPIRRGAELGSDVMVLEGVAPGEKVASEGAYLLKSLYLKQAGGGASHDH